MAPHEPATVESLRRRNPEAATRRAGVRVIISATFLGIGGIRTHLVLLCQLLRRHGIGVTVFATDVRWDAETMTGLEKTGVKFQLPPQWIRASRKLSALYCGLTWPWLVPGRAAAVYCISPGYSHLLMHRLKPAQALSINHEIVEPPDPQSADGKRAGKCAARLDASVANSHKVARLMKGYWPEKPIQVIPFLTADAPTPAPVRRRRAGAEEPLRVIYLGRLVEQKRPDQLVRRWGEITKHPALTGANLEIRGYDSDGTMRTGLQTFVTQNGLAERIHLHGEYALTELPGILDAVDLVVLPSRWEGLPLVLVEAMLKGVPFVACAAGGTEELGENNPDVMVTGTDWAEFEAGLVAMAVKIRAGGIDPVRLHGWAEARYGYAAVSERWLECLCRPREFFGVP